MICSSKKENNNNIFYDNPMVFVNAKYISRIHKNWINSPTFGWTCIHLNECVVYSLISGFVTPIVVTNGPLLQNLKQKNHCSCSTKIHIYIYIYIWLINFLIFNFLRQKANMPTPKHKRQLTTWQVFLSSRVEIPQLGIDSPTSSLKFGYLSTIIEWFRVVSDQRVASSGNPHQ